MNREQVAKFIQETEKMFQTGVTTEHSYRPIFQDFFKGLPVSAINDPQRSENGAPDFVFLDIKDNAKVLGYAEMKNLDENLDKIEKSEQMERYKGYRNIFLTNNFDWRFFRNGIKYQEIKIATFEKGRVIPLYGNYIELGQELIDFFNQPPEEVKSGKHLAEIMGGKARRIRDNIEDIAALEKDSDIISIYNMMKEMLVSDLTLDQFADMYAQTLVYGLFVARYNSDDSLEHFTRAEARDLVPSTNPFLREFFDHIAGNRFNKRLSQIVDELCETFAVSDIRKIVHRHLDISNSVEDEVHDPIIHFYEDFLASYDPELRKAMGAYYTPIPVVRYMVRMVDYMLRNELKIADGICSTDTIKHTQKIDQSRQAKKTTRMLERVELPKVQILDPAVGTATFLNETIKYIYNQKFDGQEGRWNAYVNDNILPRMNGFELMMAPYTIAHLKLGMTLNELGATRLRDRLHVFLTNTLSEGVEKELPLFVRLGLTRAVAEESALAAEVKNNLPVMVVMGNPPYSGVSSNETEFANSLIDKYKVEPGGMQKLQERKHWLNDDYVKFIAFAEDMIEKNGRGIVAMITNHGYIDNPTFRGMRWHLSQTFDKIYILDLHGNAKKKETAVDGGKDENVFNIMQGVAIMIAVKTSNSTKPATVYHASIFGKRKLKFNKLNKGKVEYKKLQLDSKMYYFAPKSNKGRAEYERGIPLNELMPVNSSGIVTARDSLVIDEDKQVLLERIERFADPSYSDDEIRQMFFPNKKDGKYKAGDSRGWKLAEARQKICNNEHEDFIVPISYRPFDKRSIYYSEDMVDWARGKIMRNLINESGGGHYVMIFNRPAQGGPDIFTDIFIGEFITDQSIFSAMKRSPYVAPLYVDKTSKRQTAIVYERSVTGDALIVDSIPEHAILGTAGYAGQMSPLWVLDGESFRYANFSEPLLQELFSDVEQPTENSRKVYPEDIMDYIYASLSSLSYRRKYREFLKTDFPRVPRPASWAEFWRLVKLGHELRELHLMHGEIKITTTYPIDGDNLVENVVYRDNKVCINSKQYIGGVSEIAWNFVIGGYQPAQKWLKDRKGKMLSSLQIEHYQKIISVLDQTERLMREIG